MFSADILAEIHVRSQGIPRVINTICDNLLLTAFAMESKVVTFEMLDEVTTDMRLEWPSPGDFSGSGRLRPGSHLQTPY